MEPIKGFEDGLIPRSKLQGVNRPNSKLDDKKVKQIRERYSRGNISCKELGEQFHVSKNVIVKVIKRTAWMHVSQ